MATRVIAALMAVQLLFAACNQASNQKSEKQQFETIDKVPQEPLPPGDTSRGKSAGSISRKDNPGWDKKIIRIAEVRAEVASHDSFLLQLRKNIGNTGAYIAGEEQNSSRYQVQTSLVIKVPVERFDEALSFVTSGVKKIDVRKTSSEDVSAQVVDVQARMEAKRQMRQRYLQFLGNAKNMEEVLLVQSSIDRIHEEIEGAAGRMNYLHEAAAYSTINLTLYQVLDASAADDNTNEDTFAKRILAAMRGGWDILSHILIGMVTLWPLIFLGVVLYWWIKRIRRPHKKEIS